MPDLIGWIASAILIATLARQTWRQWREPDPRGVSGWLFAGQIAASIGFVAYSWMLRNWVFIVTNTLILATAVIGQLVLWRARRKASHRKTPRHPSGESPSPDARHSRATGSPAGRSPPTAG